MHQSHLFQLTYSGFAWHTMQDLLNIHKNMMPPRCIINWKKYHKISVRTVMQKLLVYFSLFRQLKVKDISCLCTTIIFILNGYITFMAITQLEQYPDGNSVLVHHTVKNSVYSFRIHERWIKVHCLSCWYKFHTPCKFMLTRLFRLLILIPVQWILPPVWTNPKNHVLWTT